jgi:uncharacterized membrane protein YeiB
VGIDVARALAFGGMLLSHFASTDASAVDDPGWLQAIDNSADGRAAPLFCMVLGIGAGILLAHGAADRVFVKRGLLLLALGLAIWPVTTDVFVILPHYGVLLMCVPLLRHIPRRWLLPVAAGAFLVPSIVTALVEQHGMRGASQPDEYGLLLDAPSIARQLVWTGGYPIVGWVGFALVGLWVAQQSLGALGTQRRLLIGGIAVAALQPIAAGVFHALDETRPATTARGWAAFVDGTAHSNELAWYVCASGSAVAIVALCLLVTRSEAWRAALYPVSALGSMMLSAYLAHLFIGIHVVWPWRDTNDPSLAAQMFATAIVFGVFALAATVWSWYFRRGPVEALLRLVSR